MPLQLKSVKIKSVTVRGCKIQLMCTKKGGKIMNNDTRFKVSRINQIGKIPRSPSVFDDDCQLDDARECKNFEKDGLIMENQKNQSYDEKFMIQGDSDENSMEVTAPELLPEGEYPAVIGELKLEKMQLDNGKSYTKVNVPFELELEAGETRRVYFSGSANLASAASRFRPIVKGVLGEVPKGVFDVRVLEGKRVLAKVRHNTFNDITRNQVDEATLLED